MFIIGVDPGFANCGMVIINSDTWTVIYEGTVKNPSQSKEEHAKLSVLPMRRTMSAIKATIELYKPELCLIERMRQGPFPMVNELLFVAAFSARLQADLCGVAVRPVAVIGKGVGWYHFLLGNSYTTMKGGLGKVNARHAIERDLSHKFKNEHTADAANIAVCGYFHETGIDFRDVLGIPKPEGIDDRSPVKRPVKKRVPKKAKPVGKNLGC